ncbi:hypothetical protein [Halorubellus sp. PRR65]|uniref:hypothetical protein n=1 Tax=Halorubellus sp. PRR65 TaxID=3098148 RepID=UPI002B263CA5|nr:hypothetical protein [Halorubellus sp. PRR65]
MTRLYIVPVGGDWIDHFQDTVESPLPPPEEAPPEVALQDEVRVWGTTDGEQKRKFFEEMQSGDPLLFYNDGEFFAAARVGTTFESPTVGDKLWDNADSSLIYTVTNYHQISVARERIARDLDYEEGWVPHGFMRVSEDAINSLLQEYNSIEEAFQKFQRGNDIGGNGDDEQSTDHTEIQYRLIELGVQHGYDVYVAKNDKSREYNGEELGEDCIDSLKLPGFSSATTNIIEYVDVIWLKDDYIAHMFEVESTTSIYSGILRMTDFVVKVPNIVVNMHIVAPEADEDKVRKEIDRPTIQAVLGDSPHCSLDYISFDTVREKAKTVRQAGPLQQVF